MKKLLLYLLLIPGAFFMVQCVSSKSLLQKGDYSDAVKKSVKKLQKDPGDAKEISVLVEAFPRAQQNDLDQILFLRKEGRPDRWESITSYYYNIKERQDLVKTLPGLKNPATGQPLGLSFIDCDNDLIDAKKHAAEYLYAHGSELLDRGSRMDARTAYSELQRIQNYAADYKDSQSLIARAREAGITNVLLRVEDKSESGLPQEIIDDLGRLSVQDLNKTWVRYSNRYNESLHYDYMIRVAVHQIVVSPESVRENRYPETKSIPDGFDYMLDAKGNVRKDEKGNDMKTQRYREIRCMVLETFQTKSAVISASVDFITVSSNEVFHSEPARGEAIFHNESALALGDLDALSPESRVKLGSSPVPFPNNRDMVFRAGATLKQMVRSVIWDESGMFN